jgi:hypothetical protein
VENILKDSLDSIPSPSPLLKIQIIAGCSQQTFENKKFVDIIQQSFAFTPQSNPGYLLKFFYFT